MTQIFFNVLYGKGGIVMATQIAATPTLRGEEALRVLEEAKSKTSEKARRAFEMLEAEFSKMIVRERRD